MSKENDSFGFGIGIIAGVVGGIIAGDLLAPKKGEESCHTRELCNRNSKMRRRTKQGKIREL